jgi:hypothetical protein
MNHEPNLLPEQCQPEELIVFLSLRPRYLNGRENVTSDIVTSQFFATLHSSIPILNLSE